MEEAPLIDEIWIITENGITLYNYRFIDEITEDLFGGFISAINAFASEIGMIDVRLIKGKKAQLVLTHDKQNKLTFVCKIQLDQEEMNAIQYLKELKKFFTTKFRKELRLWNGDYTIFEEAVRILDLRVERDKKKRFKFNIKEKDQDLRIKRPSQNLIDSLNEHNV